METRNRNTQDIMKMQTPHEELWNTITHGLGAALSLVGLVALLVYSIARGSGWHIASSIVYGLSLITLFAASTIYHSRKDPRSKQIMRIVDHSSIFFLIAGSYTPFLLTILRGSWGWTFFGIVWGIALLGILYKIHYLNKYDTLETFAYLLMGWMAVFIAKPIFNALPAGALWMLLGGGLAYTLGAIIFYARDHKPYHHTCWHVCVLAGSALHFLVVFFYIVP